MQTCIWPSWYHCHSLSLVSVKSRLVSPFWYRLTRVVPEKRPLNVCVCARTVMRGRCGIIYLQSRHGRHTLRTRGSWTCWPRVRWTAAQTAKFVDWTTRTLSAMRYTHTHPFNGPFSGTTQVSRYQKGKTNLDFTEARDSEWQWHQLGHMQVCTLLQTDNRTSTPPLCFYKPDALPATQPTASKHWRHDITIYLIQWGIQ